ncbi:hypothetical protein ACGTRS_03620 [Burkholderia semiarida]|uniref:Uncharacterized protein n=1 Tax=Burkholderia semiarida TaxID=2843303 RepID=A0ABW7KZH2_9BURK
MIRQDFDSLGCRSARLRRETELHPRLVGLRPVACRERVHPHTYALAVRVVEAAPDLARGRQRGRKPVAR